MKNFHKGARRASAVLIGAVFFIAGFFKLMDPVGSSLIMEDYFKFLHLGFLTPISKPAALVFAFAEASCGILLITGLWRRLTAMISGALLAFFTLLSIVLAIANPSMDCGCFGEAVHLTHVQTLIKNLVLDALWCFAFLPFNNFESPRKVKYVCAAIAAVSTIIFTVHSVLGIPMMDFTTYNPGAEVQEEDAQLPVCDFYGDYVNHGSFAGKVMVVSEYDPSRLSPKAAERTERLLRDAQEAGYRPVRLLSISPDQLQDNISFAADRRTLMTLNRSNGGAVYIADQQVIRKWSVNNLPDSELLQELYDKNPTEEMLRRTVNDRMRIQGFLLYVFAVLLLL